MQIKNGSLLLFRLFGVNVFINWSWAVVAVFLIWRNSYLDGVSGHPHPLPFYIALYLCQFLIVLVHEFGHALACKSVGGKADQIVLWPLGGLAFVQPPQRPGAMLWSIAAGPLVNVALLPLTIIPAVLLNMFQPAGGNGVDFLWWIAGINIILLVFNMLPFYPLDGGQILRSLLWFICGRGLSLVIAASVGLLGASLLLLAAIFLVSPWLGVFVVFMGMQSFNALRVGLAIRRMETVPRHPDAICPNCHENPPVGSFWRCPCGVQFDTFANFARCPNCNRSFDVTACPLCGQAAPPMQWYSTRAFPVEQQPVNAAPPSV